MIWNLKEKMRKNWDSDFGYEHHHHHHHHHHHLDHHCCFKMSRIIDFEMSQKNDLLTYPPPISLSPPSPPPISLSPPSPPPPPSSLSSNGSKISPAVLFIIVILAVLFFVSGLLHLLVRFLIKHPSTSTPSQSNNNNNNNNNNTYATEMSESETLQRQLQQLFHLHDSGLDQAFIDALPVFHYKEIVGLKEPFDCAVCLCEFSVKDKLRLLPICSHAFHINCIDTWLLTNSTCPLCRGALFTPEFSMENPMFNFDDSRENGGFGLGSRENCTKRMEIEEIVADKGVLSVRLGKFRRLDKRDDEFCKGETSSSNLDARRCFSMGSYQYIVNESNFQVSMRRDQDNVRDENHVSVSIDVDDSDLEGKKISSGTKRDSYSVSKIWLWSKKGKYAGSSLDTDLPSWMPRRDGL